MQCRQSRVVPQMPVPQAFENADDAMNVVPPLEEEQVRHRITTKRPAADVAGPADTPEEKKARLVQVVECEANDEEMDLSNYEELDLAWPLADVKAGDIKEFIGLAEREVLEPITSDQLGPQARNLTSRMVRRPK